MRTNEATSGAMSSVVPHTGAWIEKKGALDIIKRVSDVVPHVGAWIEIGNLRDILIIVIQEMFFFFIAFSIGATCAVFFSIRLRNT